MSVDNDSPHSVPLFVHFVASDYTTAALATTLAAFFSTPAEVIKTRIQLAGEISTDKQVYRGTWHALKTILKHEGFFALYKGIIPALAYQV